MSKDKIELGDKVKCSITGFNGIAFARTQWLHGCDRITVQPTTLDDKGNARETQTFDEMQLILVRKAAKPAVAKTPATKTGGPQNDKAALKQNKI